MLFNRPARSFQRAQAKVHLLNLRRQLTRHCERDRPYADICLAVSRCGAASPYRTSVAWCSME